MENLPTKVDEQSMPFWLMDKLDDDLIIQELEGRLPQVLTYHFSDKGQEVWGLSKSGVDEATSELAKKGEVIREIETTFTDGKDEGLFQVRAARFVINKDGQEIKLDEKFGFKRQSKKTATGKDNPFWYEQGAIKACRNASMRLIPKSIVEGVIEYAKKQGKVKEVKPTNGEKSVGSRVSEGKPEEAPHSPPKDEPKISQKQAQRWYAIGKGTGASDADLKDWLAREYGIHSSKDIPLSLYDEICRRVKDDLTEKGE